MIESEDFLDFDESSADCWLPFSPVLSFFPLNCKILFKLGYLDCHGQYMLDLSDIRELLNSRGIKLCQGTWVPVSFSELSPPDPSPASECCRALAYGCRWGGGGSHFGRLKRKPVTLYTLCVEHWTSEWMSSLLQQKSRYFMSDATDLLRELGEGKLLIWSCRESHECCQGFGWWFHHLLLSLLGWTCRGVAAEAAKSF